MQLKTAKKPTKGEEAAPARNCQSKECKCG